MSSQSGGALMTPHEKQVFVEEFEKDLTFLQLFFLLVNKSCPIKKIDLVWAQDGLPGRVGLRETMGTANALESPCAALLVGWGNARPDPSFCSQINDNGRWEAESCGISDKSAEQRVRKTRRAEVYRCHAGLVDIAVPVFSEGQHLATLLTGQVLREPPSASGFVQILSDVSRLSYLDPSELEKAYYQVPVVTDEDIRSTIEVLEVFAEYLGNCWRRLTDLGREQTRRSYELQLYRKELAHLMLEPDAGDRSTVHELMGKLGISKPPNWLLVVKLESEDEYYTPSSSFDLAFTAALQAIEDTCAPLENVMAAYLRRRGVCVFFNEAAERTARDSHFRAHGLASRILAAIAGRTDIRARIGIGRKKPDSNLLASYNEALLALAGSAAPIAVYDEPSAPVEELQTKAEALCCALSQHRTEEAKKLIDSLPLAAASRLGGDLDAQRHFFGSVLETLAFTAHKLGTDDTRIAEIREAAHRRVEAADGTFELQGAFLDAGEQIVGEVRRLYYGKREKIIDRAYRIVERELEKGTSTERIAMPTVATALGVSAGHFSRTFRKIAGVTFERYLMTKRVELAKRLLLDPANTVAAVSERCGFSEPTYFARVFRQIEGLSPSEFVKHPGEAG